MSEDDPAPAFTIEQQEWIQQLIADKVAAISAQPTTSSSPIFGTSMSTLSDTEQLPPAVVSAGNLREYKIIMFALDCI